MYELIQVAKNTFYINSPSKIGLYRINSSEVVLIDSGNVPDEGKIVEKHLIDHKWTLKAIINTHSHSDHVGGNHYLEMATGCKVFCKGAEREFVKHMKLVPSFMYGGKPTTNLQGKIFMAEDSNALGFDDPAFPKELTVIELKGHTTDHVGIRTPDDVVFLGDSVMGSHILKKYLLTYIFDIENALKSLDKLKKMEALVFIPSHTEPMDTDELHELVQINREGIFEVIALMKEDLKTPMTLENLVKKIFDDSRRPISMEQYVLVSFIARCYLTWMKENNMVDVFFEENRMLWKSI